METSQPVLAVESGGSKLQLALGLPDGTILERRRGAVTIEEGAAGILAWFEREIPSFIAACANEHGTPAAIGIGFGGPIESATGQVLASHQVRGWDGIPLRAWFEERFELPAVIANDTNAAGWAEYCCGAGQGTRTFCYMNIGSGIGGALVVDGKLHDGQGFGAAEIGHTYVPDWTAAGPGAPEKLENLCSGWRIEARIRAWDDLEAGTPLWGLCGGAPDTLDCALLGEAARRGDARAIAEIDRVADSVGIALANVLTLVHPERIAMGGGVSLLGDVLLEPIRERVARRVFGPFRGRYRIVPCALAEDVVLAGALLLAAELAQDEEAGT